MIDYVQLSNTKRNITISVDVLLELLNKLTMAEFKLLMQLIGYVNNDNILAVFKSLDTNLQHMSTKLNISYEMLRRTLTKLIKNEIISKTEISIDEFNKQKVYIINPWIYTKSSKIPFIILDSFKNNKWKHIIFKDDTSRQSYDYSIWEYHVGKKYNNKCACCNSELYLEAHHIYPYATNYEQRLDVNNGIILCRKCHNSKVKGSFHNVYGTVNNTKDQLQEYINVKRKELGLSEFKL